MDVSEIRQRNKDILQKKLLKDPPVRSNNNVSQYSPTKSDFNQNISFGKRRQWFSHQNETEPNKSGRKSKRSWKQEEIQRKKREQRKRDAIEFRYGNYHQYYGYRNPGQTDSRIMCMKQEWFNGKDVLDVGCNAGHFTLEIAREFSPRSIIGLDIDNELVVMAMRNVRHYVKPEDISEEDFPISLALNYGPVAQAMDPKGKYSAGNFPFNVQFVQGNYVLPSDEFVMEQEEYFDTVLCMSLTKWIHLNWGDNGIKRMFQRIYNQLRPGGHLLLEAQTYQSYAKKKKITEDVFRNYSQIKLYPEKFNEYLLREVGFETCELVDKPDHSAQGFRRPIYLFTKKRNFEASGETQRKHVIYHYSSDSHCEDSDVEQLSD